METSEKGAAGRSTAKNEAMASVQPKLSNETLTPRGSLHHRPKSANIPKKYQSF